MVLLKVTDADWSSVDDRDNVAREGVTVSDPSSDIDTEELLVTDSDRVFEKDHARDEETDRLTSSVKDDDAERLRGGVSGGVIVLEMVCELDIVVERELDGASEAVGPLELAVTSDDELAV